MNHNAVKVYDMPLELLADDERLMPTSVENVYYILTYPVKKGHAKAVSTKQFTFYTRIFSDAKTVIRSGVVHIGAGHNFPHPETNAETIHGSPKHEEESDNE